MKRYLLNFSRTNRIADISDQCRHMSATLSNYPHVSWTPSEWYLNQSCLSLKKHFNRLPILCTSILDMQRLKPVITKKFRIYSCLVKSSSDLTEGCTNETEESLMPENESTSLIADIFLENLKEETQEKISQNSQTESNSNNDLAQMLGDLAEEQEIIDSEEDETVLQFLERIRGEEKEEAEDISKEHVEEIDLETNQFWKGGLPQTDVPCPGCGAHFQCNSPTAPGYMPLEKFGKIKYGQLWQQLCFRCTQMKDHKKCLESNVTPEEYLKIIKEVKDVHALVLVVIDLTDLPHSIFPNLAEVIGKKRPIYIVGNKVDLLPNDSKDYLEYVKKTLITMVEDACLTSDNYVNHYALVSGKTGYGIEELITQMFGSWGRKGHVFILGCTNVGKSSIFNMLLKSDFCKSTASDVINRATTSVWPGTTLNLLKFPILDPVPWRLARRRERLKSLKKDLVEDLINRRTKLKNAKTKAARRIAILQAPVERTLFENEPFMDSGDDIFVPSSYSFDHKQGLVEGKTGTEAKREQLEVDNFSLTYYKDSRWCYDTPGVVNNNQIINKLNQKELEILIPDLPILPRTYVVKPGHVIFVSGLGRIDYVKGPMTAYFTVFTNNKIPVHVIPESEAELFYTKHVGTEIMGVPLGDASRLEKLQPLIGQDFNLCGVHWKESVADITLSSIGWVSVTIGKLMKIHVRGYTPGGIGCVSRKPLLPYAVNLKGKRIKGRPEYMNRKPNL